MNDAERIAKIINRYRGHHFTTTIGTVLQLHECGCSVDSICELLNISKSKVIGYLGKE